MIKIDISKVKDCTNEIDVLIGKYKENINSVFYELNLSSKYWIGEDNEKFIEIIDKQKLEYDNLIEEIKDLKKYVNNVSSSYDKAKKVANENE